MTGLFVGLAVLVVANAAVILALARGGPARTVPWSRSGCGSCSTSPLVVVARLLLGARGIDLGAALFFVAMLSLLTLLDDWYRPVQAARFAQATCAPAAAAG